MMLQWLLLFDFLAFHTRDFIIFITLLINFICDTKGTKLHTQIVSRLMKHRWGSIWKPL